MRGQRRRLQQALAETVRVMQAHTWACRATQEGALAQLMQEEVLLLTFRMQVPMFPARISLTSTRRKARETTGTIVADSLKKLRHCLSTSTMERKMALNGGEQ